MNEKLYLLYGSTATYMTRANIKTKFMEIGGGKVNRKNEGWNRIKYDN